MVMDSEKCTMKFWFVVQQPRAMQEEEKMWLTKLQTGKSVDRGKRLVVTKAEQDYLSTLMDLIWFFL